MMRKCRSGKHWWDDFTDKEKLARCCNGWVYCYAPIPDNGTCPIDGRGESFWGVKLVPEKDKAEIERLQTLRRQYRGAPGWWRKNTGDKNTLQ